MRNRIARALVTSALLFLVVAPAVTHAQVCRAEAFLLHDMTGVYISADPPMRVEIYPCGGIYVQWDNMYGTHRAVYYGTHRVHDGGIAARGVSTERGAFLDDSYRIGFKPAEPGYLEVVTLGVYTETFRVYRLKKIR